MLIFQNVIAFYSLVIDFKGFIIYVIASIFTASLLGIMKPLIFSSQKYQFTEYELFQFKYHPDVFEHFLNQTEPMQGKLPESVITYGNSDAPIHLTVVSNLLCNPCAKAHPQIAELMELFAGHTQFSELLVMNHSNPYHQENQAFRHFMELENQVSYEALLEWYETRKFRDLKSQFPVNQALKKDEYVQICQQNMRWCHENQVQGTPLIFINNQRLPEYYSITDLKYILPEFI